jgi:hypothetical protein
MAGSLGLLALPVVVAVAADSSHRRRAYAADGHPESCKSLWARCISMANSMLTATRTTDRTEDPYPTGDVAHAEVRYLDVDGDGLPDAVGTTETSVLLTIGDATVLRVVDKIEAGIDDEGVPSSVQVTETLRIGREWIDAEGASSDLAIAAR